MGFSSEKEKVKFEHKLKIRRIILDKTLWGIVFIILGITANIVLEKYKADLTSERFFLEKKYDSALIMQKAMANLINQFQVYTLMNKKTDLPKDYLKKYSDSLLDFVETQNKSYLLFSEDYGKSSQYFILIFNQIILKDVSKWKAYREFLYDVAGWFHDTLCRELGLKSTNKQEDYPFKGLEKRLAHKIAFEKFKTKFLDSEFDKWEKWRKNNGIK